VDHKSSKPYDDEEMSSKIKQLYFYGPLVASIFGKFPDYVGFNFIRKNSLKFDRWDMTKFKESTEWFKDGIKQIEETKIFVEKPDYFFCNNICNHRLTCTKKASMKEKKKEVVEDFEGYE
jgi:hypothetical protein